MNSKSGELAVQNKSERFLFILTKGKYDGYSVIDALNLLMVMATYELTITVVFAAHALYLLKEPVTNQTTGEQKVPYKSASKMVASLELYDIDDIRVVVDEPALLDNPSHSYLMHYTKTTWEALAKEPFKAIFRF